MLPIFTTMKMINLKKQMKKLIFFSVNEEETESRSSINLIIKSLLNRITLNCGIYGK